jgi:menaquinone-dependent protoporphyrinogen IX oxidase
VDTVLVAYVTKRGSTREVAADVARVIRDWEAIEAWADEVVRELAAQFGR